MSRIPVVIDTDPGIDDFFALMLAGSAENLDIRAILTVAGNQVIEKVTDNAGRICRLLKLRTRLAEGAAKPIVGEQITAGHIHGSNGLGELVLEKGDAEPEALPAWDVLYEEARRAGGALRIIAIGPLTNIAIALLKYPDLKSYIRDIVIMGGSTGAGNASVYGEFNIVADPEAADVVFKSGIPLTMVGLNATEQAALTEEELEELLSIPCRLGTEVRQLLRFLQRTEQAYGFSGILLHDALAVACVADEDVLSRKPFRVAVETRGRLNRGRTVVDLDPWRKDTVKNALVAMEVDKAKYFELLKSMLRAWQ